MKKLLFVSFILLSGICAHAQTWNIGTPNAADVVATLSNDTLYIRGTGNMQNFSAPTTSPWRSSNITTAAIGYGVTGIGMRAFFYCSQLTSVIIPESVTNIGISAFMGCSALTSISIPENVTMIASQTFDRCDALASIIIPKNVTMIDAYAFASCNSLGTVTNLNPNPQAIDAKVFDYTNINTATLIVPCGSLADYQNAPVWQDFGTIKELPCRPGVANVKANFSCPGQVTVNYDLSTTDPTDITLYYSPDGGKTWLLAQTVTGDLTTQSTGTGKTIVWDNRADKVRWGKFRLKVEVPKTPEPECVMIDGVCWAKYNVGAPGTFVANPEDTGMYYQWGSNTGWSTTEPLVSTDGSTAWSFTWDGNRVTTWETANNVCPGGFRVPTESELQSLIDAGSVWKTVNGINGREFGSGSNTIFLPATGRRDYWTTRLGLVTAYGYYWAGDNDGSNTLSNSYLLIGRNDLEIQESARSYGYNLRCVRK